MGSMSMRSVNISVNFHGHIWLLVCVMLVWGGVWIVQ